MDFSTIRRKLKQGQYTAPSEIKEDVDLVFDNCFVYNKGGYCTTVTTCAAATKERRRHEADRVFSSQ